MNDEEIIEALRAERPSLGAVELAELLGRLFDGGLTQGTLITFFKRAFPEVPLRTLLDAGAWVRVSGGGMDDEEFENLLGPWIGRHPVAPNGG